MPYRPCRHRFRGVPRARRLRSVRARMRAWTLEPRAETDPEEFRPVETFLEDRPCNIDADRAERRAPCHADAERDAYRAGVVDLFRSPIDQHNLLVDPPQRAEI